MSNDDKAPETHNVTSINQTGGVTAHTVNVTSPPQRVLNADLKAGLLALPREKPMRVLGQAGDTESMTFARELHAFLSSSGFKMATPVAYEHQFFNVKPKDVNVNVNAENGKEVWLTIGRAQ